VADTDATLGKRVAITGRLGTLTRAEASLHIQRAGGIYCEDFGPRVETLVVGMRGWPLLETGKVTRALELAEAARARGEGVRIVSEQAFRELVGLDPAAEGSGTYTAPQVAAILKIEPSVLERWEHLGLVHPAGGRYDFRDLVGLRTVADLIRRGVSPRQIRQSLERLRGVLPGVERPLAQLKILADGGRILAEVGDVLLSPDGQLELDFERQPLAAPTPLTVGPSDAAGWIARGVECEQKGEWKAAERAYRRAVGLAPSDAAAQFNLGNVLMARKRYHAAVERLSQATALDPSMAAAWFNLAHALDELGRLRSSAASLRRAVAADPEYADAWYNLAQVYEKLKDDKKAALAWREYLRRDQTSPWAAEARRRLAKAPSWA
jgi:tetratricopeptide (TPR) repeat protein